VVAEKMLLIGLALGLTVHMAIAAEEDPVYGRIGNLIIKKSDFERLMGYYNPQLQQNIAAHPQQKV
jgi:hypothetical protein